MPYSLSEEPTSGLNAWFALGLVTAALGLWSMFLAFSPAERRAPYSPRDAAPAVHELDRVPGLRPLPPDRGAALSARAGTAKDSPYDVMVAMAEIEALGDALARARGLLPDSDNYSIPFAPR